MAKGDYYVILGVTPTETPEGIREAFRRLARRYHPDVAGPAGSARFRDIAEAYETLSDPDRRARYNRDLHGDEIGRSIPIRRDRPADTLTPEPVSIVRDFGTYGPSLDDILRRILRNFTGVGVPKGEEVQPLSLEITLTPDEAARGGSLPIAVPVFRTCPLCGGTGDDWGYPCVACRQEGLIPDEKTVTLRIEPGVRDNSVYEVPITGLGIHNFYLQAVVRVVG